MSGEWAEERDENTERIIITRRKTVQADGLGECEVVVEIQVDTDGFSINAHSQHPDENFAVQQLSTNELDELVLMVSEWASKSRNKPQH